MQRHAFILDFHFASRKEISFEGESLNEFGRRKKWPKPCQHEHELQRPSQPQSSPGAAETQQWNGVVAAKLKQLTFSIFMDLPDLHGDMVQHLFANMSLPWCHGVYHLFWLMGIDFFHS